MNLRWYLRIRIHKKLGNTDLVSKHWLFHKHIFSNCLIKVESYRYRITRICFLYIHLCMFCIAECSGQRSRGPGGRTNHRREGGLGTPGREKQILRHLQVRTNQHLTEIYTVVNACCSPVLIHCYFPKIKNEMLLLWSGRVLFCCMK